MAPYVLCHRIRLKQEAKSRKISVEMILQELIKRQQYQGVNMLKNRIAYGILLCFTIGLAVCIPGKATVSFCCFAVGIIAVFFFCKVILISVGSKYSNPYHRIPCKKAAYYLSNYNIL